MLKQIHVSNISLTGYSYPQEF